MHVYIFVAIHKLYINNNYMMGYTNSKPKYMCNYN